MIYNFLNFQIKSALQNYISNLIFQAYRPFPSNIFMLEITVLYECHLFLVPYYIGLLNLFYKLLDRDSNILYNFYVSKNRITCMRFQSLSRTNKLQMNMIISILQSYLRLFVFTSSPLIQRNISIKNINEIIIC